MVLSQNLTKLIHAIISTQEFWKVNYYLRSMKKAPHGGVFHIEYDEDGVVLYHINVEQLWNPNIFEKNSEDLIVTNYIYGTYYPNDKSFEHIDFSVNQYSRKEFEQKYQDAEQLTGISINTYGNFHYKIWCVRSKNLTPNVWSTLVCASLDAPFRSIFFEAIGGAYNENVD